MHACHACRQTNRQTYRHTGTLCIPYVLWLSLSIDHQFVAQVSSRRLAKMRQRLAERKEAHYAVGHGTVRVAVG